MNLTAFLNRGARHAPSDAERAQAAINSVAEATRKQWLNALMVDETRAWLSIGEVDHGVIQGMAAMLAIAGFAHAHDAGSDDTPDLRVIRGALSAAAQCAESGSVVSADHARAFSSAVGRATAIVRSCTVAAIIHANHKIRESVGLT